MGWSIGYDSKWKRDIGYGVPATCDHPRCGTVIDRGLSHVCGGEPYGGQHGCGLFFCSRHTKVAGDRRENAQLCTRCYHGRAPYSPTPDAVEWLLHKLRHESWSDWRRRNPTLVMHARAELTVRDQQRAPVSGS